MLDTAPATPAAEVYTGVLYDALGLATLDTAARRRANRWLVVISALHGAVRPGDRITAYRLSMGSTLPGLGPLAAVWRPRPGPGAARRRRARGRRRLPVGVVRRRVAPGRRPRPRWVQVRVPGASHMAKHTRGLVARHLCQVGATPALGAGAARRRGRRVRRAPRGTRERQGPVGAGRGGPVTAADAVALLERLLPVVVFLLAITVVAEVAERAGVFDVAGHWVAHAGRHRAWALWLLFALLAVGCTIVLSLDTTAVLLTPVGLAVARQVDLDARVFAVTTLWIANTGSLLLPVSNLTNLLALQHLRAAGARARRLRAARVGSRARLHRGDAGPGGLLHRRTLTRSYAVDPPADPHDACCCAGPPWCAWPSARSSPRAPRRGPSRSSRRRCCSGWPGGAPRSCCRGCRCRG